jgi:hypothetical protein
MKKYLPYILTILFFGVMLFLSIMLNSCNQSTTKRICIVDSFYEKKPIAINEIQITYVYRTSCGNKIFTYENNRYHINDTIKY